MRRSVPDRCMRGICSNAVQAGCAGCAAAAPLLSTSSQYEECVEMAVKAAVKMARRAADEVGLGHVENMVEAVHCQHACMQSGVGSPDLPGWVVLLVALDCRIDVQ